MEQGQLQKVNVGFDLPSKYDSKILDSIAGNTFLSRVQLCGGSTEFVKEQKVSMGHFAVVTGQDPKDIGDHFDCLVLGWRTKAMQIEGKSVHIHYDMNNPEFKRIEELAGRKTFEEREGCMSGPEFLLYIGGEGFVTYFLNSKSSQWIAKKLNGLTGHLATVASQLVKGEYTYHAPKVTECNTPMEIPDEDTIKKELEGFYNPKVTDEDVAVTAERG